MIPQDFEIVTKDEFYRLVMAVKTHNIHPRPERHETHWEIVHTRALVGWDNTGWFGSRDGATPIWAVSKTLRALAEGSKQ